jgi:hypothetical protein
VNTIQVHYKFPDGKTRCVSAPDSNGNCLGPTPLHVTIWPDYTDAGNAEDDFAVIMTDYYWFGAGPSDYAYIYADTMSAYSRLQLYGYGWDQDTGGTDGVLRTGSMGINWYGSQHFILDAIGTRVCRGDSGGPVTVYESVSKSEMQVVGLISSTPLSHNCGGSFIRATRLSGKVSWIKQVTGAPCAQITSATTKKKMQKCF